MFSEQAQTDVFALMKKYAITQNGFLPADAPVKVLPDPYYSPWETIIHHLPELLKARKLRRDVEGLPLLSTNKLRSQSEWRRAYVILIFLTHAYIWGGEQAEEVGTPSDFAKGFLTSVQDLAPSSSCPSLTRLRASRGSACRDLCRLELVEFLIDYERFH